MSNIVSGPLKLLQLIVVWQVRVCAGRGQADLPALGVYQLNAAVCKDDHRGDVFSAAQCEKLPVNTAAAQVRES